MNKKIFLCLFHIPVWIIALLIAYFFSSDDVPAGNSAYIFLSTISFSIWFLLPFYTFYSYLIPAFLDKGKNKKFWLYTILFVVFLMPAINLILFHATNIAPLSISESISIKGLTSWAGSIGGTIFCGGLGSLYRFTMDWFNHLQVRKDFENVKLQSELEVLKSKLNPHLLFNTLNNIDTLIQINPEKASLALSKLSNLLRYVVYETESEKVSIFQEIEIILQYIDLENMRLSRPDSVEFHHSVEKEIFVPPMMFLPFIENGYKHSDLNLPNQNLAISISLRGKELLFRCINSINEKKQNHDRKGVGIALVKKRLDLLYPKTHELNIDQTNNEYRVHLKINLPND